MSEAEQQADGKAIPLVEEQLRLDKRTVETGRVQVQLRTDEDVVRVQGELASDAVDIQRVPVGLIVESPPLTRHEGDVTIIPVVEEVMVKRFLVREEVRITRTKEISSFNEDVTLRRQQAFVDRTAADHLSPPTGPTLLGPEIHQGDFHD